MYFSNGGMEKERGVQGSLDRHLELPEPVVEEQASSIMSRSF